MTDTLLLCSPPSRIVPGGGRVGRMAPYASLTVSRKDNMAGAAGATKLVTAAAAGEVPEATLSVTAAPPVCAQLQYSGAKRSQLLPGGAGQGGGSWFGSLLPRPSSVVVSPGHTV